MSTHRIIHCLRAPVGGLFRHVRDLVREQAARGHAVGLVCDADAADPLTASRLADLEPHLALGTLRVSMPREVGLGDVAAARATRDLAQAVRAGILHGHGAKGGAYARLAAAALRRRAIPVVALYTPHGGSLHYHPASLKGRAFMAAERYLARRTAGLIFESAYAARTYATNVGPSPCPVRVIHNGISAAELAPVAPASDAADFLFVGELRRLKGVDLLIQALATLSTAPDTGPRLVVVGAGPDRAAFEAEARSLGVEARVSFAGAMPARDAFRLGRCLVMPSRAESLPYVALEAAGAGLPLVAASVGGVPEIVAGTDTTLVPPEDVQALAAAMRSVLADAAAAAARASRLQARIAQGFSVSAMTDAVLALYDEVAVVNATVAAGVPALA